MQLWHMTADAPRTPGRVSAFDRVTVDVGTWPAEPGQAVWLTVTARDGAGRVESRRVDAVWQRNADANSYWRAEVGPFADGTRVEYAVHGRSPAGAAETAAHTFTVGPKLHLALLWHQHQPLYRDLGHPTPRGSYTQPWVRLHALRDYYAMAAIAAEHPSLRLTINLTPVLLAQIEDYAERGATDQALELTLVPAGRLSRAQREAVLGSFFDADWHHQVFPHARYHELLAARQAGEPANVQDVRDLQMWFSLAWFGKEFRDGEVRLATGEVASVRRFVERQRGFDADDVREMVAEQYKILRAVVPLHRALQDAGRIEVSTTPFAHPILPLLIDTDRATVDRPGAALPPRFAYPDDADAQVRLAVECYTDAFGRPPRGMWPAEGAVSESAVPYFAAHGVRWIATDRGVLARSGRWGYAADDPNVSCQPYRAEADSGAVSVFFRDAWLSDRIGFDYQHAPDAAGAARDFLAQIKTRAVAALAGEEDRVLTVVLDGENAWGAYPEDGRPFLHALYGALERDPEIRTVTFAEYLDGDPARGVRARPVAEQPVVHDLFTGSWIDEWGSAPGVDLGTWIGEAEENRAWALLGAVRDEVARSGATVDTAPAAFRALFAAEGSDWFWWFGDDQESGNDAVFDDLFRTHLRSVYGALGLPAPAALEEHIVPRISVWSFTAPVPRVQRGDRIAVVTNCPGELTWYVDDGSPATASLLAAGGVMAGQRRHHLTLGPFDPDAAVLRFRFRCTHAGCDGRGVCCRDDEHTVWLGAPRATQAPPAPAITDSAGAACATP